MVMQTLFRIIVMGIGITAMWSGCRGERLGSYSQGADWEWEGWGQWMENY